VAEAFEYSSDTNDLWLTEEQFNNMLAEFLRSPLFFRGHDIAA